MKNEYIVRMNDENNHLYINMSEIIWATPIAMSTAIDESEWKMEMMRVQFSRLGKNLSSRSRDELVVL